MAVPVEFCASDVELILFLVVLPVKPETYTRNMCCHENPLSHCFIGTKIEVKNRGFQPRRCLKNIHMKNRKAIVCMLIQKCSLRTLERHPLCIRFIKPSTTTTTAGDCSPSCDRVLWACEQKGLTVL